MFTIAGQGPESLVKIQGLVATIPTDICLDTCGEISCIATAWLDSDLRGKIANTDETVAGADKVTMACRGKISLTVELDGLTWNETFLVIDNLAQSVLIGLPTLRRRKIDTLSSVDRVQYKDNQGILRSVPFGSAKAAVALHPKGVHHISRQWPTAGILRAARAKILLPRSEMADECVTSRHHRSRMGATKVLLTSCTTLKPYVSARGIGTIHHGKCWVVVANPTDKPIVMEAGDSVAHYSAQAAQNYTVQMIGNLNPIHAPRQVNLLIRDLKEATDFPEDLKDLPDALDIGDAKTKLTEEVMTLITGSQAIRSSFYEG